MKIPELLRIDGKITARKVIGRVVRLICAAWILQIRIADSRKYT